MTAHRTCGFRRLKPRDDDQRGVSHELSPTRVVCHEFDQNDEPPNKVSQEKVS